MMHEKLVEEWLTNAGERGGFDQAFAQLLSSQGHEVLWQGHSRIEFGKDIITIDSSGTIHAYQIKDEDLTLSELRKHDAQINELVTVPILHPRVAPGAQHVPHLITSGLAKEEVNLRILAQNQAWKVKGFQELEIVDRGSLVPRFVQMADSFWPHRPRNIKDFFSFYLADGRGDFDPQRFSALLRELMPGEDAPRSKVESTASALAIIGNYMLSSFERERDHWSLFRGWVIIAAHVAWYGTKRQVAEKRWRKAFDLATGNAFEQLKSLTIEASATDALAPSGFEIDDLTRTRNTIVAGACAASILIHGSTTIGDVDVHPLLKMLIDQRRLFAWGESALPLFFCLLWACERHCPEIDVVSILKEYVSEVCDRNTAHTDDEPFEPPQTDPDTILARLFAFKRPPNPSRKAKHLWAMHAVIHLLARRNERAFLTEHWKMISKLDLMSFHADDANDLLLWEKAHGRENHRKPRKTQSWELLQQEASRRSDPELPDIILSEPVFSLLFFLAYPHRISSALVNSLDSRFGKPDYEHAGGEDGRETGK